jgi:DNA-binding protein YbaB
MIVDRGYTGMPEQRWGFEEDDEWEGQPDNGGGPPPTDDDTVRGADPNGIVTVVANLAGEPIAVQLEPRWAETAGPHGLPDLVRTAANGASAAALGRQVSDSVPNEAETPAPPLAAEPAEGSSDDPIAGMNRVLALMDTVTAELEQFEQRLSTFSAVAVAAGSGGRHVTVNGRDGQVLDVVVDPNWAGSVRASEIESELLDALRQFHRRATPDELAEGPQSPAITELNNLVRNPSVLLRELGLLR